MFRTRCTHVPGILAVFAVAILLGACGGGSEREPAPGSGPPPPPAPGTHGRFVGTVKIAGVAHYADATGRNPITATFVWVRDPVRWRDFAYCWFSGTGGLLMSLVPVVLLVGPAIHMVLGLTQGSWLWFTIAAVLCGPFAVAWWFVTVPIVRARLRADLGILDESRIDRLQQRVEQVVQSRAATLDHDQPMRPWISQATSAIAIAPNSR